MIRMLIFNLLFLAAVGLAFVRGGRPERQVALIFVAARALTLALVATHVFNRIHGPEYGVLTVDILTFAALMWVAATADRFWPLPIAAMQGTSLLAHLTEVFARDLVPEIYINAVQLWSYPQLLILLLGSARVPLRAHGSLLGRWPFPR